MFKKLSILFGLFIFLFANTAHALNAQLHRPTTGATGGYKVHTTETLEQGQLAVGLDVNFSDDTFESDIFKPFLNNNFDIVDQLATFDFLVSVGLFDWLTFNMDLPVHFFTDINVPGIDNTWDVEPGDLLFSLKARLVNAKTNDMGIGVALIPFITAPSGQFSLLQGDATVTGGTHVAFEKIFKMTRIYATIGARFRRYEALNFVDKATHEFLYGAGVQQTLVSDWGLDFITEISGSTNFQAEIASPAEIDFLFRKGWGSEKRLLTHVGFGLGLGDGYGSPDWRIFSGISFLFGGHEDKPAPVAAAPAKAVEEKPTYIELKGKINFKTASAEILPASYPVLDDAVAKMKAHPEIAVVEIEGHTDSQGKDDYNQDLSERRAKSVKDYFVDKGIASERLTTQGYGESKPVATNDTADGRAQNRHISFRVVKFNKK